MNPIVKALEEIKYTIPMAILEKAFFPLQNQWGGMHHKTLYSLDYFIRQDIIDARVLVDCNLVGGMEAAIPLSGLYPQYYSNEKMVWTVPLERTQNRMITRVYAIVRDHQGLLTRSFSSYQQTSQYEQAAYGLLSSSQGIPNVSDNDIQLIGENTVLSNLHYSPSDLLILRCVLENDSELNNLPPMAVHAFCHLVNLAVKSYIYNRLIIALDQGELSGGQPLGRFSSIIEGYQDAEEMYQTYITEKWKKISIFADPVAHHRHIKRVAGGLH